MRLPLQVTVAFAAGTLLAAGVSSCGSGSTGTGTVGTKAQQAVPTSSTQREQKQTTPDRERTTSVARESPPPKDQTKPEKKAKPADTQKPEAPKPPSTVTVTQPAAPPKTKTTTKTVTNPASPAQVTKQTTVNANAPADESDSGLPWWGWLLIVLLVAAIAVGMYLIGRRRRDRRDSDRAKQPATSPRAPGVSAGWPDPPQDQPPPGIPSEPWRPPDDDPPPR
jgi:cobalamin biosynthesis Mg chelatase CobN